MALQNEFRKFALKGNVVDLAVGVIIGAAFSKIVDSLVKDVIMPLVNVLGGGKVNFSHKYVMLSGQVPEGTPLEVAQKAGVVFAWGNFVTVLLDFVILAMIVFWMVKAINRVRDQLHHEVKEAPSPPPEAPEDVRLLREIRDELRKR